MEPELPYPVLVAYAEDHHLVRDALINNLEQTGKVKVIVTADNGSDLIRGIRESSQLPHVCLLDIEMPVMNGFDTSLFIRKQWPDIKILALSGYETELYQLRMVRCGADGYLGKRSRTSELLRAITAVYNNRIYNTELFDTPLTSLKRKAKDEPEFSAVEELLLKYCGEDKTLDEIADQVGFTHKSLEMHRYKLYQKIGVKSRVGLLMYAIKNGFVSVNA